MITLEDARALDAADPLRGFRDRFTLPQGVIYLDGNSLGAMPSASADLVRDVTERQWGQDLIRSWNINDWIGAPRRIGAKIAGMIGVGDDELIVCDSTSANIFKLLVAIAEGRSGTTHILSEAGNFPTDAHIADGAARLTNLPLRLAQRSDIVGAITPDTAVLLLTHVHYKTGERYDMAAVTAAARAKGVPVIWDLSHSTGAVPLDLARDGADFAVGCGYKYLNGGPGAPAFLYVARGQQAGLRSPLQGWMGHAAPFAFVDEYEPAKGIERFLCGTPPVLSLLALEGGVESFAGAEMDALWAKSQKLFDLFAELMAARCPEFRAITPHDPGLRGSHISFAHDQAWPINNALIERGVIGDFRAPDVLRFGLTPLYLSYEDVWRGVDILADIMASGVWTEDRFQQRKAVT